ncbi:hypothetical protein [Methyloprofundus sp.]|uniref:hypothetical protein n=1 Tax=Methyloprofundus sp. TaxID=2020875 RepID=UPI003D11E77C
MMPKRHVILADIIKPSRLSKRTIQLFFLLSSLSCFHLPLLNAQVLDYIYITASEGNASGGHTALRFDNETYHFQHYDGGIIRLVKDPSNDFDFQYRYLENRTFHQASLDLNEQDYAQLHNHFSLRFLQQQQQDAIGKEIKLNIALLNSPPLDPQLKIWGAGLFNQQAVPRETVALTTDRIKQQIKAKYGAAYLANSIKRLKSEIDTLLPEPWPQKSLQFSEGSFSAIPYSFASHYLDTVSKLLLLETITIGAELNQQFYFSPEQSLFNLSQAEISKLKSFQKLLATNLVVLLNSQRPDWGSAAFILYARILSLDLAIESGKLVLLDTFKETSPVISKSEVSRYKAKFLRQQKNALSRIAQLKKNLFTQSDTPTEQAYSHLEMLSNYYHEREQGLQNQQSIRISGEQLLAKKSIPLPAELLPNLTQLERATHLARFEAYRININQQMQALYSYDLFTRNCVTEIMSTINQLSTENKHIQDLSQLTDKDIIAFIPFGSFHALSKDYTKKTLPSYRHQQLEKMYREENNALVFLREFNTLSASSYQYNDQDSSFLFFTDDTIWTRPIFGSINLIAATTMSLYGSLALPFDSGRALKDGTMGILMSLPELTFFNIRKGSYKHLSFPEN